MLIDPEDPQAVATEWLRLLDQHEAEIAPRIARAIRRAYDRSAADVNYAEAELNEALRKALDTHYKRVIRTFANWVMRSPVGRRKGAELIERKGFVEDVLAKLAGWLLQNGFSRSRLAASTVMADIRKVLAANVVRSERGAADAVRDELARQGLKVSRGRAKTIARTETALAADKGAGEALQRHQERGVRLLSKQWVTSGDERVRPTHRKVTARPGDELGGQSINVERIDEPADHAQNWPRVAVTGKFIVGGFEADAPRDPSLPAKEIINCRCVLTYSTGFRSRQREAPTR